jgi:hypothetical protein
VRPLGAETRAPIDHFYPFLARFLDDNVTPQLKDLRQPGPITVDHQGLTGREMALLDAAMADIHRARGLLTVARWRQRKDPLDIGAELWLIVFDDHDVIAPSVYNGLGYVPLRQQRIHRDHPILQHQLAQHRLDLRDLIGFIIPRLLGQRQAQMVGQGR